MHSRLLPRSLLLALVLALPVSAAPPAAAGLGFSTERLGRLDRFMQQEVSRKHKSGVVVLLARHGRIAWFKAYGVSDLDTGAALRTNALFRLYSMTKPVTTVALLMLYEQGYFQLTDPLEMYLPVFTDVKVFDGIDATGRMKLVAPNRKITIQDVMRHTAGFTYGYFGDTPIDRAYRAAGITYAQMDSLKQLTEGLAKMPLLYQPGERWEYSFAHDVQAYLVEYFSGMRFDEYCRRMIFERLKMHDTLFGIPPARAARFATNYSPQPDGTLRALKGADDAYEHFSAHPFGGVSLASTPADYLRFAQMLLNGGQLDGVRLLGRKTVELMTADNLPPSTPSLGPGVRYGMGVSVLTDPAQAGIPGSRGEFGWSGHATTWVGIDPHEDLVALLFTQYLPSDGHFIGEFQTLLYQALGR